MELGVQSPEGQVSESRSGVLTAATLVFFFFVFPSFSQNLVQNGNFNAGGGSFEDWQISHNFTANAYSGPAIAGPGYNNNPYFASFQADGPGGEPGGEDIISQDLATTIGGLYDINFMAEDGAGYNFQATMNFGSFSANLLNAFATGPGESYSGWKDFNYEVTATELETDLSFVIAADNGSGFGLDNISVVPVPDFDCAVMGTNFDVTIASPTNYSMILQASTNMVSWVNVCTNMTPFTFTDSVCQFPHRYYRAALVVQQ
jgi:hypothetical protein